MKLSDAGFSRSFVLALPIASNGIAVPLRIFSAALPCVFSGSISHTYPACPRN